MTKPLKVLTIQLSAPVFYRDDVIDYIGQLDMVLLLAINTKRIRFDVPVPKFPPSTGVVEILPRPFFLVVFLLVLFAIYFHSLRVVQWW